MVQWTWWRCRGAEHGMDRLACSPYSSACFALPRRRFFQRACRKSQAVQGADARRVAAAAAAARCCCSLLATCCPGASLQPVGGTQPALQACTSARLHACTPIYSVHSCCPLTRTPRRLQATMIHRITAVLSQVLWPRTPARAGNGRRAGVGRYGRSKQSIGLAGNITPAAAPWINDGQNG